MPKITRVGMGEYAIGHAPDKLVILGLGSCIGACFYDPWLKLGALAHIMLPDSKASKPNDKYPAKFADLAVPIVLSGMEGAGGKRQRISVKLVGGAAMFNFNGARQESIGQRNAAAVEKALAAEGLGVSAKDVGGLLGRSLALDLNTGELEIRTLQVESLRL